MDFLECKICHDPYDEDGHRPRNAPCGHEFCTACVKSLILNSTFVCPRCRKEHKIEVPEDLSVNFGLIDAIREFKTKGHSTKETESIVSEATINEVCNIHCQAIGHWCCKCQIWLCDDCLETHTALLGCSSTTSEEAIKNMKEKHNKNIDMLLNTFEEDANYVSTKIQEHTDKRKVLLEKADKHCEEVKELSHLLEQGKIHQEQLVESKKKCNESNSPHTVIDGIKVMTQRKQSLRAWTAKNLGTDTVLGLIKAIKEEKDVYAEMVILNETRHAKLSHHKDYILLHPFEKQAVADGSIFMPFDRLQKMIPDVASLLFLKLTLGGVVKGHVFVRLYNDARDYFVKMFTGQQGVSLNGNLFDDYFEDHIGCKNITLNINLIPPGNNGRVTAKRGSLVGQFGQEWDRYHTYVWRRFLSMYFYVGIPGRTHKLGSNNFVFGDIEDGLDVVQECLYNYSSGVKISDCGLVIENE
ncbi:unnamed protein product [Meganyctiphanes norvegica]|uniref:RING-type domain-containing protein n=1 Tax=Meganyctiphanes norvegica TaxID=48144 RepID=A0AAV2RD61_MEGNR